MILPVQVDKEVVATEDMQVVQQVVEHIVEQVVEQEVTVGEEVVYGTQKHVLTAEMGTQEIDAQAMPQPPEAHSIGEMFLLYIMYIRIVIYSIFCLNILYALFLGNSQINDATAEVETQEIDAQAMPQLPEAHGIGEMFLL